MTFAGQKGDVGRQPNVVIEIDLDKCTRDYGVSPCTAAGPTGSECFNTFATCQDESNYSATSSVLTLRFSDRRQNVIPFENIIPCIESVVFAPTKLKPGAGFSNRGRLEVTFVDFPDNDVLTDPYIDNRGYVASDRGTFWGKLLARNPHHVGRAVRLKWGYHPADGSSAALSDFDRVQYYKIDRIDPPDNRGRVKLVAKDFLIDAERLKTQIPEASSGTLSAAVTATGTTIPLQTGEGADYAAATGDASIVRIGDELISCTGRSGDSLTVASGGRGYAGTTATGHNDDDSVQLCAHYGFHGTDRVDAVIRDLLVTYAGIDTQYTPTGDWNTEASRWLDDYDLKNIVSEPTALEDLLAEISIECGVDIWWDDEDEEIRLKAMVPVIGGTTHMLSDSQIIRGRGSIQTDIRQRLSQVYFYVGRRNYTEDRDKVGNFDNVVVRADADSEGEFEYNSKGIRKIYCQWLSTTTQAGQQASRLLNRYVNPPLKLRADVDIGELDHGTGDHFMLDSDLHQTASGAKRSAEYQTLSTQYHLDKQQVTVEALQVTPSVRRYAFIGPTSLTTDYDASSTGEQASYSFIASTTGETVGATGDEPYLII